MTAGLPQYGACDNARTRAQGETHSLYSDIKSSIESGRLAHGARLPTERALSTQHKVARNTVRKTMTRLVNEGLIVRTVGRGTLVAGQAAAPSRQAPTAFSLLELFEARLMFEPVLAELAVERADDNDFAAFDRALAGMESAPTWIDYKEAKYALHLAIARASRNRFMVHVLEQIIQTRRAAGWGRADGHPGPLSLVRESACRDSAAIIAALRARDGTRVRELVQDYLVRTLSSVSGV
jgi:DNA-binding FadR family transcriptional regulator